MNNTQGDGATPVETNDSPKPETKKNEVKPVKAERKEMKAKKKPSKKAAKKKPVKKASKKATKKKASKKTAKKKGKAKKVMTAEKATLNFKVIPSEAKAFKAKADKLCNGNLTQMVRLAVIAWKPKKQALGSIRPTTRA